MKRSLALVALLFTALPWPGRAQSLFGTAGLGLPVAPLDGRARALGGIGTGLLGENSSLVNPADVAGVQLRSISAVFQPTSQRISLDGESQRRGATRFPLIRVMYPFGTRIVGSVGYGTFLDQSWAIERDGTEMLGDTEIAVHDIVRSTGGLSQLRLGIAYSASESLALGVGGGLYTGEVQRHLTRTFADSTAAALSLQNYDAVDRWRYSGPIAEAGLRWDPVPVVRVAGSLAWSGELRGRAEDAGLDNFRVSMPLRASVGLSALLSSQLEAAIGANWANWSVAAEDSLAWQPDALSGARDVWEVGGGFEWQGVESATRTYPIRLGAHYARLPFTVSGETATEWSASLGLGVRLAPSPVGPAGLVNAAIERGHRATADSAGLSEQFWRLTLSLTLFGR